MVNIPKRIASRTEKGFLKLKTLAGNVTQEQKEAFFILNPGLGTKSVKKGALTKIKYLDSDGSIKTGGISSGGAQVMAMALFDGNELKSIQSLIQDLKAGNAKYEKALVENILEGGVSDETLLSVFSGANVNIMDMLDDDEILGPGDPELKKNLDESSMNDISIDMTGISNDDDGHNDDDFDNLAPEIDLPNMTLDTTVIEIPVNDGLEEIPTDTQEPIVNLAPDDTNNDTNDPEPIYGFSTDSKVSGRAYKAIHPGAVGIWFGSVGNPSWNTEIFKGQASKSTEEMLSMSRSILGRFRVDILIPKLKFNNPKNKKMIMLEHFEIIQCYLAMRGRYGSFSKDKGTGEMGVPLSQIKELAGIFNTGPIKGGTKPASLKPGPGKENKTKKSNGSVVVPLFNRDYIPRIGGGMQPNPNKKKFNPIAINKGIANMNDKPKGFAMGLNPLFLQNRTPMTKKVMRIKNPRC